MKVDDRRPSGGAGIAVGHGHDGAFMEPVYVLERQAIHQGIQKAHLLRATESEHVGHVPVDEELGHELAAGHVGEYAARTGGGGSRLRFERTGEGARGGTGETNLGQPRHEGPAADLAIQIELCALPHY